MPDADRRTITESTPMPEPVESEPLGHSELDSSPEELATRYACGGMLGIFIAVLVILFFAITSVALCIAIAVIAVVGCGFLAGYHGDRFWVRFGKVLQWLMWVR